MKKKKIKKKLLAEIAWARNQQRLIIQNRKKLDAGDGYHYEGLSYRVSALYDLAVELDILLPPDL